MAKIARLVALVVLAFVAYDYGWPWLQGILDGQGSLTTSSFTADDGEAYGSSDVESCLAAATSANDAFGAGIGQFVRGKPDTGAWMSFAGRVQRQVAEAQSDCSCGSEACSLASEAMSSLDSLIQETDGLVRGSTDRFGNPATRQEEIYDLLQAARNARGN